MIPVYSQSIRPKAYVVIINSFLCLVSNIISVVLHQNKLQMDQRFTCVKGKENRNKNIDE